MPTIDLHLKLEFSESVKPGVAASFAKAAIESGYAAVAGSDDENVADAADAFDDAHVAPLASAPVAATPKEESPSVKKPSAIQKDTGDQLLVDREVLETLMHAAHYHTEDLQELEDEGMLTNDSQHRAHMKSLHDAVMAACSALGVRRPKPL